MNRRVFRNSMVLIVMVFASLACNFAAFTKRAMDVETSEEEEILDPEDYSAEAFEGEPADTADSESAQGEADEPEPTPEPTATPEPTPTPEPLTCDQFLKPGFTAVYECSGGIWLLQPEGSGQGETRDQYTYTVTDDGTLMVVRQNMTYGTVFPAEPAVAENDMLREFVLMHAPALCLSPEGEKQTIAPSEWVSEDASQTLVYTYDGYDVIPAGTEILSLLGYELETVAYTAENTFTHVNSDSFGDTEQQFSHELSFNYDAHTGLLLHSESYEYLVACTTTDEDFGDWDCPGTGLHNYNVCELIEISVDLGM